MGYFKIWLGSFSAADAPVVTLGENEVLMTAFSTNVPPTGANWKEIEIIGMKPHRDQSEQPSRSIGGILANPALRFVRSFDVELKQLKFPDDMPTLDAIYDALKNPCLYLRNEGDYSYDFHASTKAAIVILSQIATDDDFAAGTKKLTLTFELPYLI